MTPDLPPSPPEATPAATVVQVPNEESVFVDSHGYRYVVNNNRRLLPADVITRTLEAAKTPQEAIDTLRLEYLKRGYLLIAMSANVNRQLVAIEVVHGHVTDADITPPSIAPYFSGLGDIADLHVDTMVRRSTLAEFYAQRQGERPKVNFIADPEHVAGSRIVVTEEPIEGASPWTAGLGFGNLGSRYSSRYTAQAGGSLRPGDGLELTATYTQGLPGLTKDSAGSSYWNASAGASVVTPWGLYAVSYSGINYGIGERGAPLFPQGQIGTGSVTGTQLVYANATSRWSINEGFTHTDNDVQVFDGTFVLTSQHYDFLTLGTTAYSSFALFGQNASVTAGVTASWGISPPRGSFLPAGPGIPSTRFTQVQGNVGYTQSLPQDYTLTLNWSGQWADATLPQNQQWVLGGFGNLTAWLPATMVGDTGSLLRAAFSSPPWEWQGAGLSASAFYEWGLVGLHFTPEGANTIRGASDAGISLSARYTTGTSLVVGYAWPLASRNVAISTLDRLGRANVYFSLNQSF